MAEGRHHQPRVRLRRSKRLRLASPAATTLSSSRRSSSCSRGGDGNNWRGVMGERAGEMFSDLTRRAISISSSEGLSSPGVAGGGVVDLTNDSGVEDELVDLTSPPVPGVAHLNGRPNCRRERGRRRRLRGDVVVLDDESDESPADEVQIMEPASPLPHSSKPSAETPTASSVASPTKSLIKCPICMESAATFERRGSQVSVTTCGHVFCDACIRRAIAEQRRCPTCRKRLTVRQVHPLYLSL